MGNFLTNLMGRAFAREQAAKKGFAEIVAIIASGQERELDPAAVEQCLAETGRTVGDLAAAVEADKTRRADQAIFFELPAAEAKLNAVGQGINERQEKFKRDMIDLQKRCNADVDRLLAEQREYQAKVNRCLDARRRLIESADGYAALLARQSSVNGPVESLNAALQDERQHQAKLDYLNRQLREIDELTREPGSELKFGDRSVLAKSVRDKAAKLEADIRETESLLSMVRTRKDAAQSAIDDRNSEIAEFENAACGVGG